MVTRRVVVIFLKDYNHKSRHPFVWGNFYMSKNGCLNLWVITYVVDHYNQTSIYLLVYGIRACSNVVKRHPKQPQPGQISSKWVFDPLGDNTMGYSPGWVVSFFKYFDHTSRQTLVGIDVHVQQVQNTPKSSTIW